MSAWQEAPTVSMKRAIRVVVIDDGRSFEHSAKLQGGAFVEFTMSSGFCLNPFSMIDEELARSDEETAVASQALRSALARIGSLPPREAFAILNAEKADDIAGQTSAAYLALEESLLGDSSGQAVTIQVVFPVQDDLPGVLREDLELPALGMPRDLDGDGEIDSADHSGDVVLLPVLLRLEWEGAAGLQSLQLATILGD